MDVQHPEKRTYDDIVFDSAGEMKMYRDYLLPLKEQGEIVKIERQKKYILIDGFVRDGKKVLPITYVADFVVTRKDGSILVYDFKGMPDNVASLKRKLFWWKYPDIEFQWIGYSKIDGGYVPYETIIKGRKERAKARKANKENK